MQVVHIFITVSPLLLSQRMISVLYTETCQKEGALAVMQAGSWKRHRDSPCCICHMHAAWCSKHGDCLPVVSTTLTARDKAVLQVHMHRHGIIVELQAELTNLSWLQRFRWVNRGAFTPSSRIAGNTHPVVVTPVGTTRTCPCESSSHAL